MPQSDVIQRIRELSKSEKNLTAFSEKIGRAYGVVSNMFSRGKNPSFEMALDIGKAYDGLNLRWLFLGEQPKWLNTDSKKTVNQDALREINILQIELSKRDDIITEKERMIQSLQDHIDTLKERKRGTTSQKAQNRYEQIKKDVQDYADQEDDVENKKIS